MGLENFEVGVGFCDLCMTRLFDGETLTVFKSEDGVEVACEHCSENLEESREIYGK